MDPMIQRLGSRNPDSSGREAGQATATAGPQLLALERELSGPGAQEALARHDAVLVGLENRLAAALNEGVSPEEYPKLTDLREANVLARKLLRLAQREGEVEQP